MDSSGMLLGDQYGPDLMASSSLSLAKVLGSLNGT